MKPTSNKTHGTTLQELQVQTPLPVLPEQSSFQTYAHDYNKPPIKTARHRHTAISLK